MDKRLERSFRDKVLRRLAAHLAPVGFTRSRPSFFVREQPNVIEFIHAHKFSFAPSFRLHAGIRVLADPFEAPALNGPSTTSSINLTYSSADGSINVCAENAAAWCLNVAEPWFASWRVLNVLANAPESPLAPGARSALSAALAGNVPQELVLRSRALLGLI